MSDTNNKPPVMSDAELRQLRGDWRDQAYIPADFIRYVADRASAWGYVRGHQAGADWRLKKCCEWLTSQEDWHVEGDFLTIAQDLRAALSPKPPSLKQQALEAIGRLCLPTGMDTVEAVNCIKRALDTLPDESP